MQRAFTLVELVVVLAIIGILVAVAGPRFLSTNETALDNALQQDLRVLRDVIEAHAADIGGELPGDEATEDDLKADLAPQVRHFPENRLNGPDKVFLRSTGATFAAAQSRGCGWLYDSTTGDIRANSGKLMTNGVLRFIER